MNAERLEHQALRIFPGGTCNIRKSFNAVQNHIRLAQNDVHQWLRGSLPMFTLDDPVTSRLGRR